MKKSRPQLGFESTDKVIFFISTSQPSKLEGSSFKGFTETNVQRHFGVIGMRYQAFSRSGSWCGGIHRVTSYVALSPVKILKLFRFLKQMRWYGSDYQIEQESVDPSESNRIKIDWSTA
jgi:hypothetical protein